MVIALALCIMGTAVAEQCVCSAPARGGTVNVRSCASTSCASLGLVQPGTCFNYLSLQDTWYGITYGSKTGYGHKDYFSAPHPCKSSSQPCAPQLCSAFSTNEKRACDAQGCGNYGASRGGRIHKGWDIKCNKDATIYAPFDGRITRKAYPYTYESCRNTGFLIEGTGAFKGYSVKIFYVEPTVKLPIDVTRGQPVAKHIGMYCDDSVPGITDHLHYQMEYNGKIIDPASYIFC